MSSLSTYLAVIAVIVATLLWRVRNGPLHPPSPPRRWLIGNLLEMPRTTDTKKLAFWKEQHGALTYLTAFGRSVLVLHTAEVIKELLDKRAKTYSHRPHTVMAGELYGLDKTIVFFDYNDRYRAIRRLTQQVLNPEASKKYQALQLDCIKLMLQRMLEDPDDFKEQSRLAVSRMILTITYGVDIKTADSEYIAEAQLTMDTMTSAAMPGAFVVDLIPILKHLPRWVPFTTFHQIGDFGRDLINRFVTRPFDHVERTLANGQAPPSFVADILTDEEALAKNGRYSENMMQDIKWAAGSLFAGAICFAFVIEITEFHGLQSAGVETSFTTMLIIFLLMALHPHEQKKAQQEIDSITGGGQRTVSLEDRPNMPYMRALLKEVARWHVVVPMSMPPVFWSIEVLAYNLLLEGVPRRTAETDIYNGYTIPADTIVVPNIWALSQTVDDPQKFDPERFLDEDNATQSPYEYIFGFGRRVCPGRYIAENFLFLWTTNLLQFFNVQQPDRPVAGLKMPAETTFTTAMVSAPEAFACKITPRSEVHRETVSSFRVE
ncbi:hypothetical protein QCA50_012499 [Cerrena zonata]|uniref:Cytochrome P450 n=1 Tax=Cerrena zonata TaxID=2478898 RepID=A0AAW0G4Q8_9APHY